MSLKKIIYTFCISIFVCSYSVAQIKIEKKYKMWESQFVVEGKSKICFAVNKTSNRNQKLGFASGEVREWFLKQYKVQPMGLGLPPQVSANTTPKIKQTPRKRKRTAIISTTPINTISECDSIDAILTDLDNVMKQMMDIKKRLQNMKNT